jgi:predicted small lipoprotein YifL
MNPIFTGKRLAALLLIVLLPLALGACGKKGPLYLPASGNSSAAQQGG